MENNDFDVFLLPAPLRQYAQTIGVGNLIKLAELTGGREIYIPKKDEILRYFTIAHIKKEYESGENIKNLAKKYGVTRQTIYNYIKQ